MNNLPLLHARSHLKILSRLCSSNSAGVVTTPQQSEPRIVLPKRIPRGPTDILQALESTIKKDPTAAHYKYHDDPYLIPLSNRDKRSYSMAQEAGKKAAHWIRKEHSNLFTHRVADPPIETFYPKMFFNEDNADEIKGETDLKKLIEQNQVTDALFVYERLTKRNEEISDETKQSLLELLCYSNCDDLLDEEFVEERWFKQTTQLQAKERKTWRDGNAAEEIFISFKNQTPENYSALIQGMAKYYQVNRAKKLFDEALDKQIPLNVDTYNSLISVGHFLKESNEQKWAFAVEILQLINQAGLKPNLGTLNSMVSLLSTMRPETAIREYTLKVLREFKDLGIEPCLATWYYVLLIFCRERGPKSNILSDILNYIGMTELKEIRDEVDTYFFVTAMGIARTHLNNLQLGEQLHKLLMHGNNYNFIGDSYKESIYYRYYFSLQLVNTPLQDFMENIYYKFVPNIYVPEPSIMAEVLNQIEVYGAIEFIPKIWSDMVIFDQIQRENLITKLLTIMTENKPTEEVADLVEKFSNITWQLYTTVNEIGEEKYNKLKFTGEILGNIIILLLRNNDFDKACSVMEKLETDQTKIAGVPKIEALSLFVDHCITNKRPSKALSCIQYAAENGFGQAKQMGAKLTKELTLDEIHLAKLSSVLNLIDLK